MIGDFSGFFFVLSNSLNDSIARVKRELRLLKHHNEMTEFIWSMFQKLAGIDNRTLMNKEQKKKKDPTTTEAPLAEFDIDDFSIDHLGTHVIH